MLIFFLSSFCSSPIIFDMLIFRACLRNENIHVIMLRRADALCKNKKLDYER